MTSAYTFSAPDYGAAMFFGIVKMVWPDTRKRCSDIKSNPENINISHLKHDIPKSNLKVAEWMNEIYISG